MTGRLCVLVFTFMLVACSQPVAPAADPDPVGSPTPPATATPPAEPPAEAAITPDSTEIPPESTPIPGEQALDSDPLHAVSLTDVRSGATFTLGELATEKPLLLETMAIWCSSCLAQQRQVVEAHAAFDFHSISLNVDPNERAPDLVVYAEREGFDWHFAIADAELANALSERFGPSVLFPPSSPKVLFFPDGTVRALDFGRIRSADEIVAELAAG